MKQSNYRFLLFFGFIIFLTGCFFRNGIIISRGVGKYSKHDYNGALKDFDLAIQHNDKNYRAYEYRAAVYYEMGNYPKAMEDAEKIILLDSNDATAFTRRGMFKKTMGDTLAALADFNLAKKKIKYSNFGIVNRELGRLLIELDSCERGAYYLKKAIDVKAFNACNTEQELAALLAKCQKK